MGIQAEMSVAAEQDRYRLALAATKDWVAVDRAKVGALVQDGRDMDGIPATLPESGALLLMTIIEYESTRHSCSFHRSTYTLLL